MPYTELYHHGILGQKWGVRRFQNKDGSLTAAGKKRYQNKDGTLTEDGKKRYLNRDGTLNDEGRKFYVYGKGDTDTAFQNSKPMLDYIRKNKKDIERFRESFDKYQEKGDECRELMEELVWEMSGVTDQWGQYVIDHVGYESPVDIPQYIKKWVDDLKIQPVYDEMYKEADTYCKLYDKINKEVQSVARKWINDETNSVSDDFYDFRAFNYIQKCLDY